MIFGEDMGAPPWVQMMVALLALGCVAFVANWITRAIILKIVKRLLALSPLADDAPALGRVAQRLSLLVPAIIVQIGIGLVPHLPPAVVTVTRNVAVATMILAVARAISGMFDVLQHAYQRRPIAASRPIKGYVQVANMAVYAACAILMIAALIDRSPLLLLSGLGAMAAVLMLVFKDTILSLVASVQLASNDMVRLGDWIEMPQLNADGDVIDIALHTVKVQNWDKTITTIPTYRMIGESFKNWRGMQESGGRRIKRSLFIDMSSVGFMSSDQWNAIRRFRLLRDYQAEKQADLDAWNKSLAAEGEEEVNARRPTNMGTFRAYVMAYLQAHKGIRKDMTLLVRQMQPTAQGLPLEIYCFTDTVAWAVYENIQSDIFDHLLAILPEFGLRLYQEPSGFDLSGFASGATPEASSGKPRLAVTQS